MEIRKLKRKNISSNQLKFIVKQMVMRTATVSSRGIPHVVPLAFVVANGRIYFESLEWSLKVKHIRQNGKVALLFDEYGTTKKGSRYRGVLVKGRAQIMKYGTIEFLKARRAIYRKYEYFSKTFPIVPGTGRLILSATPNRVVSWSYGYKSLNET
jgi:nitroimidazol reductase NimA-like FMN-containing flavoprotein (pyridoxamine 5'-phosphate oxidase superfamily)